jgi:hypothetical protein
MQRITQLVYRTAPINIQGDYDYELGGALSVWSSALCVVSAAVREHESARQRSRMRVPWAHLVSHHGEHIDGYGYEYQKMRSAFQPYVLWLNRELKTNLSFPTET